MVNEIRSLGQKVGVEITKDDIAACHKVGKCVICRFVNRGANEDQMRKKRNLKNTSPDQPRVFLNDDLT